MMWCGVLLVLGYTISLHGGGGPRATRLIKNERNNHNYNICGSYGIDGSIMNQLAANGAVTLTRSQFNSDVRVNGSMLSELCRYRKSVSVNGSLLAEQDQYDDLLMVVGKASMGNSTVGKSATVNGAFIGYNTVIVGLLHVRGDVNIYDTTAGGLVVDNVDRSNSLMRWILGRSKQRKCAILLRGATVVNGSVDVLGKAAIVHLYDNATITGTVTNATIVRH